MKFNGLFIIAILLILTIPTASAVNIDSSVTKQIQDTGRVKAVIILKEAPQVENNPRMSLQSKQEYREPIKSQVIKKLEKQPNIEFNTINGFSTTLTENEFNLLKNDPNVLSIEKEFMVHKSLQDSTQLINATQTWNLQEQGVNLTGLGQTICIIDSGANYTHDALGACTVSNLSLTGNSDSYDLESPHNYSLSTTYFYNITMPGYTSIAVHFTNISVEDEWDFVRILDSSNQTIATYTGGYTNIWSPHVEGDTINILLTSDSQATDYGFVINETLNGTTNQTYNWSSCTKILGGYDIANNDPDPMDDDGHGTHVAGIAAGNDTIQGVAPEANLVIVKSLDSNGNGTSGEVIAGIDWCVTNKDKYNISIISMSLGGRTYSNYCDSTNPSFAAAINTAVANNMLVTVATGNNGTTSGYTNISAPACITNATRVTATDNNDDYYINARRGANFDNILVAPGVAINSSCNEDYCSLTGTSMATPHVAGAAAILYQYWLAQNGSLPAKAFIENTLNNTGKLIYDTESSINYSRIKIYDAVISLDQTAPNGNNTLNATSLAWDKRDINISWVMTDNILLISTTVNVTMPNGTLLMQNDSNTGSFTLNSTQLPLTGTYSVNLLGTDANNNTLLATDTFNVSKETTNISLELNASASNFTINATDSVFINATLIAGDGAIELFIDNALENYSTNNMTVTMQFNATGEHNISLRHNETATYGLEQIDLYIITNNETPQITLLEPTAESSIVIRHNDTYEFNLTASDDNDQALTYNWIINNTLNATTQNYTLESKEWNYTNYTLILNVTNGNYNQLRNWSIEILPDNINVTFNDSLTIPGHTWDEDESKEEAIKLTDYFSNPDGDPVTYTLINGSSITMSVANDYASFSASSGYYGEREVYIQANDSDSYANSNYFTLTVEEVSSSSPSSGGGTTSTSSPPPADKYYFSKIFVSAKNKIVVENTDNDKVAIKKVDVRLNNDKSNVEIKITENEDEPSEASKLKVKYEKTFEIEHKNLEDLDISKVYIDFLVSKSWLTANNLKKEDVKLYRYKDGKWNELSTLYISSQTNHYKFSATSPGLSLFASGGETKEEEEDEQETVERTVLSAFDENETQNNETNNQTNEPAPEKKNSIWVTIAASIAAILAILLVITIFYKMAQKKHEGGKGRIKEEKLTKKDESVLDDIKKNLK